MEGARDLDGCDYGVLHSGTLAAGELYQVTNVLCLSYETTRSVLFDIQHLYVMDRYS